MDWITKALGPCLSGIPSHLFVTPPCVSILRLRTETECRHFATTTSVPIHAKEVYLVSSSTELTRSVLEKIHGVERLSISADVFDWSLLQAEGLAGLHVLILFTSSTTGSAKKLATPAVGVRLYIHPTPSTGGGTSMTFPAEILESMAIHVSETPTDATGTTKAQAAEPAPRPRLHYVDCCCTQFASPPTYATEPTRLPLPVPLEDVEALESAIDTLDEELRALSLSIHENPEVAWKEHRTHDVLCDFMDGHGFAVTRHAYGLETAWEATFEHGSGGPVVGFNSEMDSLLGIGHACGHNLIAIAGVAAALATASLLTKNKVAGKVILLGTPAEEQDGGKINLINAGAYKAMDVCMMIHPAPVNTVGSSLAIAECEVEYIGHTAHAAASPWEALNAQVHPTHRIHGIIINDNWVQNVIPGSSKLIFAVRCPTLREVEVLKSRVAKCFEAAALATGCEMKMDWVMSYSDLRQNAALSDCYTSFMSTRFDVRFPAEISVGASTDFGNVSYEIPALHPVFAIPCGLGEGNHTVGFAKAAGLADAHRLTLDAAKGISIATWKFITDSEFASRVKAEFAQMKSEL
ncbi:hypothetical protein RQP46_001823 [Phenoliferia psychrophenolica]